MIYQTIIHSFESTRKVALADIICYCKMTSVMALDGVASVFTPESRYNFLFTNLCDAVKLLAGIILCNGGKLEAAEDFKCVFAVYCVLESN